MKTQYEQMEEELARLREAWAKVMHWESDCEGWYTVDEHTKYREIKEDPIEECKYVGGRCNYDPYRMKKESSSGWKLVNQQAEAFVQYQAKMIQLKADLDQASKKLKEQEELIDYLRYNPSSGGGLHYD